MLQSAEEAGLYDRRSRYTKLYHNAVVSWVLDPDQYETFQAFFEIGIHQGSAQFELSLRYPKNSELTAWVVAFVGGYEAQYVEGMWQLQAELDLVRTVALPEIAFPDGHGPFYVGDPDNSGETLLFSTPGGNPFYVKES